MFGPCKVFLVIFPQPSRSTPSLPVVSMWASPSFPAGKELVLLALSKFARGRKHVKSTFQSCVLAEMGGQAAR